jgi:hypothetical protein
MGEREWAKKIVQDYTRKITQGRLQRLGPKVITQFYWPRLPRSRYSKARTVHASYVPLASRNSAWLPFRKASCAVANQRNSGSAAKPNENTVRSHSFKLLTRWRPLALTEPGDDFWPQPPYTRKIGKKIGRKRMGERERARDTGLATHMHAKNDPDRPTIYDQHPGLLPLYPRNVLTLHSYRS